MRRGPGWSGSQSNVVKEKLQRPIRLWVLGGRGRWRRCRPRPASLCAIPSRRKDARRADTPLARPGVLGVAPPVVAQHPDLDSRVPDLEVDLKLGVGDKRGLNGPNDQAHIAG